ncbi:MAG: hypothetical protein LBH89_02730 [Lactococcus lactis]|jgi:hypothetical protein|nr:hypothetical protein [Lactococcus lactis]
MKVMFDYSLHERLDLNMGSIIMMRNDDEGTKIALIFELYLGGYGLIDLETGEEFGECHDKSIFEIISYLRDNWPLVVDITSEAFLMNKS